MSESYVISHLPETHKALMVRHMLLGGNGVPMPAGGTLLPAGGEFPSGGGFFGSAMGFVGRAGKKGAQIAWKHRKEISQVAQAGLGELAKQQGTMGQVGSLGAQLAGHLGQVL